MNDVIVVEMAIREMRLEAGLIGHPIELTYLLSLTRSASGVYRLSIWNVTESRPVYFAGEGERRTDSSGEAHRWWDQALGKVAS
jgi:hypothetical protein